jgi:uncharacterized protein YlxW (UPF0749 family)
MRFRSAKWMLPTFMVAVVLGILISVQFQAQQKVDKAREVSVKRAEEIKPYIQQAIEEKERLIKEQKEIKAELEKYKNAPGGASSEVKAEIDKIGILNGETDVEGPGVHIEVDDRKVLSMLFPIQDYLMETINVLKYAGAEAIEVNGQRIGARTAIVSSGTNILINGVPISRINGTHWEIEAIGNQEVLKNYVQTLSVDAYKTQLDLNVMITPQSVRISSAKDTNEFGFAKPTN